MAAVDYAAFSAEALLDALEEAGRHPDLGLIQVLLDRRQEVTPGLLDLLAAGVDEDWAEDDPRWYREIHAGLLLIAFREPAALPLFEEILFDPEREVLLEWFDPALSSYGPPIVPLLLRAAGDPQAPWHTRNSSVLMLATIALQHPALREEITAALRRRLPLTTPDGHLLVDRTVDEEQVAHWSFVVSVLADLKDEASRSRIETLYEEGVIDEMILGDVDDYRALLRSEDVPREASYTFDVLENYGARERRKTPAREAKDAEDEGAYEEEDSAPQRGTYVHDQPQVGRNDPCPCGSGRKYKRCCGR
jgi:hypothetical protein